MFTAIQRGLIIAGICLFATACSGNAADIPDAPLEPAIQATDAKLPPGAILEFWFLPRDKQFTRMPVDPSVTAMIDDSDKVFLGSSMLKDPEMRNYVSRHGILQWTAYFQANKPGKYVFVLGAEGMWSDTTRYGGVSLLVNDEEKVAAIPAREESCTVDLAKPGLYKLQVRMWWTHGSRPGPVFQDYRASLKVREPGALGLRQVTKKDLFHKLPE